MKNNELRFDEGASLFTDSDYEDMKKYGITDEQIETLKDAESLVATAKLVPNNVNKLLDAVNKVFPNDIKGAMERYVEVAQKDPKFLAQLLATIELAEQVEVVKPASVEKITAGEISSQETANAKDAVKEFLDVYKSLSPAEKAAFVEGLKSGR